jgi:hypothetical protein
MKEIAFSKHAIIPRMRKGAHRDQISRSLLLATATFQSRTFSKCKPHVCQTFYPSFALPGAPHGLHMPKSPLAQRPTTTPRGERRLQSLLAKFELKLTHANNSQTSIELIRSPKEETSWLANLNVTLRGRG